MRMSGLFAAKGVSRLRLIYVWAGGLLAVLFQGLRFPAIVRRVAARAFFVC